MKKRTPFFFLFVAIAPFAAGEDLLDYSIDGVSNQWSLSGGMGYKNNVLLSEVAPVDSSFAYLSSEGGFKRQLNGGDFVWDTMYFLDYRSYEESGDLPSEGFLFITSKVDRYVGLFGELSAGLRYLYFRQAFDVTFDILDSELIDIKANEPKLFVGYGSVAWDVEYELEASVSRMKLDGTNSDYDSYDIELQTDYMFNESVSWKSELSGYKRSYLDRFTRDADGDLVSGTRLKMHQQGLGTGISVHGALWDFEQQWELSVGYHERRDGQFGYYDRDRLRGVVSWLLENEKWRVEISARQSRYDYNQQIADNGDLRESDTKSLSVDIERRLNDSWSVFGQFETDNDDSNDLFSSYDSESVLIGVSFR